MGDGFEYCAISFKARVKPRDLKPFIIQIPIIGAGLGAGMVIGTSGDCESLQKIIKEEQKQQKTPGRNDPCSCGSRKKYKKCCGP